jgi:hypothetical protein
MKVLILVLLFVFGSAVRYSDAYSQETGNRGETGKQIPDTVSGRGIIYKNVREKPDIKLSKEESLKYLQAKHSNYNWNDPGDPLRQAIGQLIYFSSNNPFDSTRYFFDKYPFDSIDIPWDRFYIWDTLRVKIPVVAPPGITMAFDTIILVAADTLTEVTSSKIGFPFRHYNRPYESDSIIVAIKSLLSYVETRDSSIVNISNMYNEVTPVWLNSGRDRLVRYWLHNESSDSVTIWIGNVDRNTLGMYLENGIIFRRPTKQSNFSDAQLNLKVVDTRSLQEVRKIAIRPQYWKLHSEASFILNQAALFNWVKGGENSVSTVMDITGYADYNNKQKKLLSNNFLRLKYGLIASGKPTTVRKNLDLLESNSKLNHKAFGKFDFSSTMLFKTQLTRGYNYPNDSVPISKFLNPAVLTMGLGLDYKPNKNTSLNFAPFSYKATFVTDTANIDQTRYGIPNNKKSIHEPGVSFMITNEYKPYKNITIINRLQLFTNYIHNPMNIDVDWEMIATVKINWFTDVRFNTHLIFDDDTKTPLYDKEDKPVMGPDGKQKKTARIQFKELLGFTFVFRF